MDPMTVIALLGAFVKFVGQIPELVIAGETAIELLKTGNAPTVEQQAVIDAGLDAANAALQAS